MKDGTEAFPRNLQPEAVLQILNSDVLKSSEIESDKPAVEQVRSSITRRLGTDIGALKPADRHEQQHAIGYLREENRVLRTQAVNSLMAFVPHFERRICPPSDDQVTTPAIRGACCPVGAVPIRRRMHELDPTGLA